MRPLAAKISSALGEAHTQDDSVPEKEAGELAKELEKVEGDYSVVMLNEKQVEAVRARLGEPQGVRFNEEPALITRETGLAPDILARVRSLVSDEIDGKSGWSVSVVNENGAALSDIELHEPEASPSIRVSLITTFSARRRRL